jgi:hypothetical protein
MSLVTVTAEAAKGGNGGGNNGGGKDNDGQADIVLTVESSDPAIWSAYPLQDEIISHDVSSQGQSVYYDVSLDMSLFAGSLDSGPACDQGIRDGVLVIAPNPKTGPVIAELLFWFTSELESGDGVTHLFRMDGEFTDPQNWPPAPGTSTDVMFNFWEFFAENRKAQRQDCAGESAYPAGPWYFTVSQAEADG